MNTATQLAAGPDARRDESPPRRDAAAFEAIPDGRLTADEQMQLDALASVQNDGP